MKKRSRVERIAELFRSPAAEPAERRAARLLEVERFAVARTAVSAFYAVLFFLAAGNLYAWDGYLAATALEPRWPVFWLRWVEPRTGIAVVLWLHLAGGLAAVALSRYRWARIAVFVTLLQFLAFRFSFGSINHGEHLGLLIAFVLVFLPSGWSRWPGAPRSVRLATLLVVSGVQGLILLTYSMSGLWKLVGIPRQLLAGESSYLHLDGLARQVAAKLLAADATSPLGPWLIDHPWVGWPLGLAAIYLELFALWVLFRPSLHRAWGLALILFHLGTHLTMGIGFVQNALWLALFLVLSPFRPAHAGLRPMLRDLPLVGRLL